MMKFCQRAATIATALALTALASAAGDPGLGLVPRKPVKKTPTADLKIPKDATGRLVVKFMDDARMRPVASGRVQSLSNAPVNSINLILERHDAKLAPSMEKTEAQLRRLEQEVAAVSGKAQPDLAGMMHARAPRGKLLTLARELNDHPSVEWVEVEQWMLPNEEELDPMTRRACCLPDNTCQDRTLEVCDGLGGVWNPLTIDCNVFMELCDPGVCCIDDDTCLEGLRRDQCDQIGGFATDSVMCMGDPEYMCDTACGGLNAGNCFQANGNATPSCDQGGCCDFVCELDPFCCDEDNPFASWDEFCAALANTYCPGNEVNWDPDEKIQAVYPPLAPDRCAGAIMNGNCYEFHLSGGCNSQECCNNVCELMPSCCDGIWSGLCAFIALNECGETNSGIVPGEQTPDYTNHQGYLTPGGYPPPGEPGHPEYLWNLIPQFDCQPYRGWGGEGYDLDVPGEEFFDDGYDRIPDTGDLGEGNGWWDPPEEFTDVNEDSLWQPGEPFVDLNGDGIWTDGEDFDDADGDLFWDRPGGLRGLAERLLREQGVDATGMGNITRGQGSKVAVIEWGFWDGHEELNVISEPGQEFLSIPELTYPDHATACLSIIGAKDNGKGVVGIVPDTQLYFFPLTSISDGPRQLAAWTSAVGALGAGDVISASYGPAQNNLNTVQSTWTMLRMASDKGIASCVSAGNDCLNLDNNMDLGDSGAFVIGACSPGAPHYRLNFSNFCTEPDAARGNICHFRAWGELVTAAGYGALQLPGTDLRRSYTQQFNGTSSAAPIMAGIVCAVQGYAQQIFGIPLPIETLRNAMGAPGTPPQPPTRLFGGPNNPCTLDLDPEADQSWAGVYLNDLATSAGSVAAAILTQGDGLFPDSPLIDDIVVVRGDNIRGNRFSIKADDQSYFKLDPLYTRRNQGSGGGIGEGGGTFDPLEIPEAASVVYLLDGSITDVIVVANADIPEVNTMFVQTDIRSTNVFALTFVENYDWRNDRWLISDVITFDGMAGGDVQTDSTIPAPQRFVSEGGAQRVLIRLWTVGFPAPRGGLAGNPAETDWEFALDWVNLFVSEEFGKELP